MSVPVGLHFKNSRANSVSLIFFLKCIKIMIINNSIRSILMADSHCTALGTGTGLGRMDLYASIAPLTVNTTLRPGMGQNMTDGKWAAYPFARSQSRFLSSLFCSQPRALCMSQYCQNSTK